MRFATTHRAIAGLRALCGDRRGGPIIEFALAAPAVFLFLFGILELGYAMWIKNALDFSVGAASRYASLCASTSAGCSGITAYAASQSGADVGSSAFTYTRTASCGCQVTGSYTIALDIPWDNALSVTLTSDACVAPPPNKSCAS